VLLAAWLLLLHQVALRLTVLLGLTARGGLDEEGQHVGGVHKGEVGQVLELLAERVRAALQVELRCGAWYEGVRVGTVPQGTHHAQGTHQHSCIGRHPPIPTKSEACHQLTGAGFF